MRNLIVRRARKSDSKRFLDLVVSLARFEKLKPPDDDAKKRLLEDVFSKKRLGLFLAFSGSRPIGYALYYFGYSSFLARPTFYLEDIFVSERHRDSGVGRALFRRCTKEAVSKGCGRMEWVVLTWNQKAITFYEQIGAKREDNWSTYRLSMEQLKAVAESEGNTSK